MLLFIPAHRPFELMFGDSHKGLQLYIQRVLIMDDCEALLPPYLRFVRGVVDSPDLPLNVSREMLQQSALLEKIKNNLVHTVLRTLDDMEEARSTTRTSASTRSWGVSSRKASASDWTNREKLADLLLFESTKTEPGKFTTLGEYVERMPVEPEGDLLPDRREPRGAGAFAASGGVPGQGLGRAAADRPDRRVRDAGLPEYKGKKLKAIDKGELPGAAVDEEKKQALSAAARFPQGEAGDEVKDVRLSGRLKESAACLVADEGRWARTWSG